MLSLRRTAERSLRTLRRGVRCSLLPQLCAGGYVRVSSSSTFGAADFGSCIALPVRLAELYGALSSAHPMCPFSGAEVRAVRD